MRRGALLWIGVVLVVAFLGISGFIAVELHTRNCLERVGLRYQPGVTEPANWFDEPNRAPEQEARETAIADCSFP